MTYQEAVEMYPHDEVHIQIDDVVRLMTPAEYEAFIQRQVNAVPIT
jgi:DNA-binding transcriptional regulator/RsmH inhibitor MraZ